jgi:NAD(P)-dependent dehydrogenase (short-subunit alcohol dehydrogenase family)
LHIYRVFALFIPGLAQEAWPVSRRALAMRLKNKVAVVTGAGSGIGLETSILFAKEGAAVVLADVNDKAGKCIFLFLIKDALEQALKFSQNVIFVQTDVSNEDSVRDLIAAAVDRFGKLNIIFNNAGIMHPDDDNAVNTLEKVWDLTMNINVKGVWYYNLAMISRYGCKYAIPEMLKTKEPCSVINTASFVYLAICASFNCILVLLMFVC